MNNKKYKHLFIDLDRTLWDFDKSAQQTFEAIFEKYQLAELGIPNLEEFKKVYVPLNDKLWEQYRNEEIKKEVLSVQRFALTLKDFGIEDEELAKNMAEDYVNLGPTMINLFPYTHELLSYLHSKYQLHIVTNGFEEVQQKKLDVADLRKYFTKVITSEMAGAKKPEPEIFDFCLKQANASAEESIMIGDDFKVDVLGAKSFGMDQIYVNYKSTPQDEEATYEVNNLKSIEELL